MSIWKEFKVGNIAKIENGFAFKSKDFSIEGVPIIKIKNVKPSLVNTNDLSYVPFEIVSKLSKYKINKGDILITMSGNRIDGSPDSWVGKVATFNLEGTYLLNQRVSKVIVSSDDINPIYLSYVLSSIEYQQYFINEANSSGGQANISPETVRNTTFNAPDLPTQIAIAEILSSLDDKIELNNKINQELETLAQTLFKQWFIDFEFPNENGEPYKSSGGEMVDSELGEIPKGWAVGTIESLTQKMNSGGTPSTRNADYYDGNIIWYSTKELKDNFIFDSERTITLNGLNSSSAKLFPTNTVVMAIYAAPTVGRLGILSQESAFNQAALGFVAKVEVGYEFMYLLLKYLRDDFNNLANGAAQQNLNVGLVKNFKILMPLIVPLAKFQSLMKPVFESIKNNQLENDSLIKTRDTLLPKLISGELEINELFK